MVVKWYYLRWRRVQTHTHKLTRKILSPECDDRRCSVAETGHGSMLMAMAACALQRVPFIYIQLSFCYIVVGLHAMGNFVAVVAVVAVFILFFFQKDMNPVSVLQRKCKQQKKCAFALRPLVHWSNIQHWCVCVSLYAAHNMFGVRSKRLHIKLNGMDSLSLNICSHFIKIYEKIYIKYDIKNSILMPLLSWTEGKKCVCVFDLMRA